MAYGLENAIRQDGSLDGEVVRKALQQFLRPSQQNVKTFAQALRASVLDKIFSDKRNVQAFRKIIGDVLSKNDPHTKELIQRSLPQEILKQAKPTKKIFGIAITGRGAAGQKKTQKLGLAIHQQVTACPLKLGGAKVKTLQDAQSFQKQCRGGGAAAVQQSVPVASTTIIQQTQKPASVFTQKQLTFLKTLKTLSQEEKRKFQRMTKIVGFKNALRTAYGGAYDMAYDQYQTSGALPASTSSLPPVPARPAIKLPNRRVSAKRMGAADLKAALQKQAIARASQIPTPLVVPPKQQQTVDQFQLALKNYNALPEQKVQAYRKLVKSGVPKGKIIADLLSQEIDRLPGATKAKLMILATKKPGQQKKTSPRLVVNKPPPSPPAPSTTATPPPPPPVIKKKTISRSGSSGGVATTNIFQQGSMDKRVADALGLTQQQRVIYSQKRKTGTKINKVLNQMGKTEALAQFARSLPIRQRGAFASM